MGCGKSRTAGAALDQSDGVAHASRLEFLDASNYKTDFTGFQGRTRLGVGRKDTQLLGVIRRFAGHELDAVALGQTAIDHAHQHDHTHIGVVPAVNDHGAQGRRRVAFRRRDAGHDGFENFVNAHAALSAAGNRIGGIDADDFFDFLPGVVGVGLRQVHFVEHRHHGHAQIKRGVAVGDGLRLNALTGIDHQQRTFAGRQRAADFVREVNMARRVDQVEVVDLAIKRLVLERSGLRLDGDATLFFDIHRIEHLRTHFAILQAAATLDKPVRQGGFTVINVRNDRKISDVIHQEKRLAT